jgi:hypothetical protein
MKNTTMKAAVLSDMVNLLNQLECKLSVVDTLDRDFSQPDSMDLHDQVHSMSKHLHSLTGAVRRANEVNGVDAEYDNLFGETNQ